MESRAATVLLCLIGIFCWGCESVESPDSAGGISARQSEDSTGLVAASNMLHPPFSSWDEQGKAVGIEVEIVEEAANSSGLSVKWVEMDFSDLLVAVQDGQVDLAVSTIGITEARRQRVAFSDPYFETTIVALVREDSGSPMLLSELAESRIGADRSTTSFAAAEGRWPSAALIGAVEDGKTWPRMVQEGSIEAFVVDASDQERLEGISGIKLRRLEEPLAAEYFGVAMRQDADALRRAVNDVIARRQEEAPRP